MIRIYSLFTLQITLKTADFSIFYQCFLYHMAPRQPSEMGQIIHVFQRFYKIMIGRIFSLL